MTEQMAAPPMCADAHDRGRAQTEARRALAGAEARLAAATDAALAAAGLFFGMLGGPATTAALWDARTAAMSRLRERTEAAAEVERLRRAAGW